VTVGPATVVTCDRALDIDRDASRRRVASV
jgi:hypothetical protein